MSSDIAVSVRGLGKCYQVYEKPRHRLKQSLWRGRRKFYQEFWALRDVDFDIGRGQTVGIIGQNGSGKSTLLQLIAGTLTPTEGEATADGRVTALLELGAGFNPEFTGRENVFMNAAIMGLSRREIRACYDRVIEFSEIGDFIDRPIKTYSSGMMVRLAFAVSINLDPDIFIVDEALSVGDVRFQSKCFRKFKELQSSGVTILFVTHSTELIINHCQRAIFLDGGGIRQIGEPRDVVHAYLNHMFGTSDVESAAEEVAAKRPPVAEEPGRPELNSDPAVDGCQSRRTFNQSEYRWGDQRARIIDYLLMIDGEPDPIYCRQGDEVDLYMVVHFSEPMEGLIYGLTMRTVDGVTVYGSNTRKKELAVGAKAGGQTSVVNFRFRANLVAGDYFISLGVALEDPDADHVAIDRRYDIIHLRVEDRSDAYGVADLSMNISETSLQEVGERLAGAGGGGERAAP